MPKAKKSHSTTTKRRPLAQAIVLAALSEEIHSIKRLLVPAMATLDLMVSSSEPDSDPKARVSAFDAIDDDTRWQLFHFLRNAVRDAAKIADDEAGRAWKLYKAAEGRAVEGGAS